MIVDPVNQKVNLVVVVNVASHGLFAAYELVKAELDLLTLTNIINKKESLLHYSKNLDERQGLH